MTAPETESALTAGSALDERIAERLFGWLRLVDWVGLPGTWGQGVQFRRWRTPDGALLGAVPRYSRDIARAWEVVEKMRERDWRFTLHSDEHTDSCFFWRGSVPTYWHQGDSAPEIICRAALAALDTEESS